MARILCVEDDPDFQRLISRVLRNQGYEVHYAFTGPEGREKALALNPDLILMDIVLPGLNGIEVIKLLRKSENTKRTPVIVMTSFHAEAGFMESDVASLPPIEYLRKPVRPEDLLPRLRALLGGAGAKPPAECWVSGGLRFFPDSRSVWAGNRMIAVLPPKRFGLLVELSRGSGEVPWHELVRKLWGRSGRKNDLEKTVERLRRDLGDQAYRVETTRCGYRLVSPAVSGARPAAR